MKTSGSYPSLLQGVSQQPPEVRQPGQHTEQVNMIPDPVQGLTRRRGTIQDALKQFTGPAPARVEAILAGARDYREMLHTAGDQQYLVLMRSYSKEPFAYPPPTTNDALPPVIIYNLTKRRFVAQAVDSESVNTANLLSLYSLGAATSVGKFVVFSNKGTGGNKAKTTSVSQNISGNPVLWIRGGAYTRTYQVKFGASGSVSVTTPNAGVAGAAEAISPENIAENLRASLAGLGYSPVRIGSHVFMGVGTGVEVTATDGGDGSLIRTVGNVVDSVDKLTLMALNGSIVQIGSDVNTCFYMQAVVKNPAAGSFGECVWKETAAKPDPIDDTDSFGINMLYVDETPNTFTLGRPAYIVTPGGVTAPKFVVSRAGNAITNPIPTFMLQGQTTTFLAMFQDRLLVGSGAAIAVSAAGDYFNFFRTTTLTVPASDAFEMIAQGGEDDIIRNGVPYSKNLVLFGEKQQYIISGSQALTPTSANMSIMTTYQQAAYCPPLAAGGQIYYVRNKEGNVGVHQIQPGAYVDSAESFPTSSQIGDYIPAEATQLQQLAGVPATLIVRTRGAGQKLYHFHYTDQPDGRKQAAWGTWQWDAACGQLMGVQDTVDGLVMIWLRVANGNFYLVADRLPLNTGLSNMPYLDSLRPYSTVAPVATKEIVPAQSGWHAAFDNTTIRFLIGGELADAPSFITQYPASASSMWVGLPYPAYAELTNPYVRDGSNKAILTGRLVVTSLRLSLKDTSGVVATVTSGNAVTDYSFNGRILGDIANRVGRVPVTSEAHTVPIGRETREYTVRLAAQKWFPLTFVGVEWTGQSYNRTPRAQS